MNASSCTNIEIQEKPVVLVPNIQCDHKPARCGQKFEETLIALQISKNKIKIKNTETNEYVSWSNKKLTDAALYLEKGQHNIPLRYNAVYC
jgi:hypothetical protein